MAVPVAALAQSTWNAGNGDWSVAGNWNPAGVPDAAGAVVDIPTGAVTVTIDTTSRTIGALTFGGTGAKTINRTGSATLTFDNDTDPATLHLDGTGAGSQTISTPVVLASDLVITGDAGNTKSVNFTGGVDGAGKSITINSGSVTMNSSLSGAGTAVEMNGGTLYSVFGTSHTYDGGFTLNGGNVTVDSNSTFGTGPLAITGGTITLVSGGGSRTIGNTLALSGNITLAVNSTGTLTLGSSISKTLTGTVVLTVEGTGPGPVVVNGVGFSGSGGLTKDGSGVLSMWVESTYTGPTVVNAGSFGANRINSSSSVAINGGSLSIGGNNSIGDSTPVTINGGTLSMGAFNDTVGDLVMTGGSIVGGASGALTAASYDIRAAVDIDKVLAGTGRTLTKSTTGTATLSQANTYTGATAVNAGTLVVAATGSIHDSSAITVAAGAELRYNSATARTGSLTINGDGASRAILSGTGAINLALTLNNIGDTLSPGNSPGLMPFGTNQSWNSFTYLWETNNFTGTTAGTHFDQINITGSLTLTGGIGSYAIDITSLTAGNTPGDVPNFSEVDTSWTILTTTTGITGFDAAHWNLLTSNFTSSPAWTGSFSLDQDGNNLVLTYTIPEPSSWLLLGLGLSAILLRRRIRP